MNLKNLVEKLRNCQDYEAYVTALLNEKFKNPKVGGQSDQAHTPIHPVKPADPTTLTREEWKVYDLISRHFLACCSQDAVGIESEIIAEIGKERFKASHLTIK
jgi:DNA topoisomerase-3